MDDDALPTPEEYAQAQASFDALPAEDFQTKDPRLVFECLHKIGGRDVLAVLR